MSGGVGKCGNGKEKETEGSRGWGCVCKQTREAEGGWRLNKKRLSKWTKNYVMEWREGGVRACSGGDVVWCVVWGCAKEGRQSR